MIYDFKFMVSDYMQFMNHKSEIINLLYGHFSLDMRMRVVSR